VVISGFAVVVVPEDRRIMAVFIMNVFQETGIVTMAESV